MAKKIYHAGAKMPEFPKVRYMRRMAPGSSPAFTDVTLQVSRIELELLNGAVGPCALVRLSAAGEVVWKTVHQSEEEARTQANYEYGVADTDWEKASD